MRTIPLIKSSLMLFLGLGCLSAHGDNLTTTTTQTGSPGTTWASGAIWKTNGTGTAVGPTAGNTYEAQSNGTQLGNATSTTILRNPYSSGVASIAIFPGDSLILDTNTQIRFKALSTSGSAGGLNFAVPTNSFPGGNGLPGLVLNGGCLNTGDTGDGYTILGTMQAKPGTLSFLNPADTFSGSTTVSRGLIIASTLSGSGSIALVNAITNIVQVVKGTGSTFSGQWIVKAGWLQGAGDGTGSGYNALGTNSACSYLIDPQWAPPATFNANAVFLNGPAVLDMGSQVANCAGSLALNNGGTMYLHGVVAFQSVTIDGTPLSQGQHPYTELRSAYPANFLPGGSGMLIVQPYGKLVLLPLISAQPTSDKVYAGVSARLSVTASDPLNGALGYIWQKNGVNLTDGGNVAGSATANLVLSSTSAADAANYDVVVTNSFGSVTSSIVNLSLVVPSGEAYESAVLAAGPMAFYELNETDDSTNLNTAAYDFVGGYVGRYGSGVQNGSPHYGVAGPTASAGFPGFAANNAAARFTTGQGLSQITAPAWNLNTNTVTLMAWIYPTGTEPAATGIIFCRSGSTVAGLDYTTFTDPSGNPTLGYTWNNEYSTYTWDSGLTAPVGQWSFVALVVTPSSATIHVMNAGGLVSATHIYPHTVQAFAGPTLIGDDSIDGGNGGRAFGGTMDDVAVFNRALSKSDLTTLFYAASGTSHYAPIIAVQPVSASPYEQQTSRLSVTAGGTDPLSYQWFAGATGSGTYHPLSDGSRLTGSTTAALSIANISLADSLDYFVVVANTYGSVTSSIATLTVQQAGAAEDITMSAQEAAGADWDTGASWSDGQMASDSAVQKPGSIYEVLAGARLRSPQNPNIAIFPGKVLKIDGDGVWNVNPAAGATIGELRFKQPTSGTVNGTVIFPQLVMNGGQLDVGNDGVVYIGGEIDVMTNAPINNDGGNDRGYRIDAWLTGTGTIEYHGSTQTSFMTTYSNNLNIACSSNTFSGKWNVVNGTLLGTGSNALGTNDITLGTNAVLETTYDINNPTGNLIIRGAGKVYLHQNDTFQSVVINGSAMNPGTYSFQQLTNLYPANFPATWTPQFGAGAYSGGSGSITILAQASPKIVTQPASLTLYAGQTAQFNTFAVGNAPLGYRWRAGASGSGVYTNLSDQGRISGSSSTTLTISSVTKADAGDYVVVVTNSVGSVTSLVASLTVLDTSPAENITMVVQQVSGNDWNSGADWSDGNPASLSSIQKPGSTYEILPGARMRSPFGPTDSIFPGDVITVDGSGVFTNNFGAGSTTQGEIRFKHSNAAGTPGSIYFKRLVMNGGQLDAGDNGLTVITGEVDIATNSIIAVDNSAGGERAYRIDAWLTGTGRIEWDDFDSSLGANGGLNIAGATNTFTGTWSVVTGLLLGSAPNALGTNSITVGANGALETTYDLNSPNASLVLNGRMLLHQNDTFGSVTVAGSALLPGTYTFTQLTNLYPANFLATWTPQLGATNFASGSGSLTVLGATQPVITVAPAQPVYVGETVQMSIPALGGQPNYQWEVGTNGVYVNLNDGGQVSGSRTNVLTLSHVTLANAADYLVRVSNPGGAVTSLVATLTVQPVGSPLTITMSGQEPINSDWETASYWSDGRAASRSAVGSPGSTYEILPGAIMRTPGGAASTNFPGAILKLDGNGVFDNTVPPTTSELRFKHADPGIVYFKKLILNGGQLGNGDNGTVILTGEIDVVSNTPIYATVGSTAERPFQIDAWLTGNGSFEYHAYDSITGNLNVTGSTNTFSGTWNIVQGVLLGSGPNSLGYGDLDIGDTNGSPAILETLYDINNPRGNLNLGTGGQMYLHQNDHFAGVTIGGVALPAGTYSFDYLASNFPGNFPTAWTQQPGSTFSAGSGSITVLGAAPPDVTLNVALSAGNMTLTWSQGTLMQATSVNGPWSVVSGATSPFVIVPSGPAKFYRVKVR